jgi:Ca-activated chloride channel family protein
LGDGPGALEAMETACTLSKTQDAYSIDGFQPCAHSRSLAQRVSTLTADEIVERFENDPFTLSPSRTRTLAIQAQSTDSTIGTDGYLERRVHLLLEQFARDHRNFPDARRAISLGCALARIGAIEDQELLSRMVSTADWIAIEQPSFDHFLLAGWANQVIGYSADANAWFGPGDRHRSRGTSCLLLQRISTCFAGRYRRRERRPAAGEELIGDFPALSRLDLLNAILEQSRTIAIDSGEFKAAIDLERGLTADSAPGLMEIVEEFHAESQKTRIAIQERAKALEREPVASGKPTPTADGSRLSGAQGLLDESLATLDETLKANPDGGASIRNALQQGATLRNNLIQPPPLRLGVPPSSTDELWIISRPSGETKAADEAVPPQLTTIGDDGRVVPLPLRTTVFDAKVRGPIASVGLHQTYHNPFDFTIDVDYQFPLPYDASVTDFRILIGDRTIRGIVREREEAEAIFKAARERGHLATLFTQQRANVFTQNIANVAPGEGIEVILDYVHTVRFLDGEYELVIPTVVGPRFHPPTEGPSEHSGPARSTDGAATTAPRFVDRHEMAIAVDLSVGYAISEPRSPTHDIAVISGHEAAYRITLADGSAVPNRDFVLRWSPASSDLSGSATAVATADAVYFTALLNPMEDSGFDHLPPTEHVLVVDCSGSMAGVSLDATKSAVTAYLGRLRKSDTFRIIRFANKALTWPSTGGASPVTWATIDRAVSHVSSLEPRGGTMMLAGITAALDLAADPDRRRIVSVFSDGFIGNESVVLSAIHEKRGNHRIFTFGAGTAPNRFLLQRIAVLGNGAVAFLPTRSDEAADAIDVFFSRIAAPAFEGIRLTGDFSETPEIYPTEIPDVLVGRPVIVTGRIPGLTAPTTITLRGFVDGRSVAVELPVEQAPLEETAALPTIWARMKIADIADRTLWESDRKELVTRIRNTALEHGLVSQYTAFVLVDATNRTANISERTVVQLPPLPEGMNGN